MAGYSDILKQVDSSLATFDSAALKAQKKLMEQVMMLSKELDHDPATGAIKTTISNLQKIAKIKATIAKIVCDDQYKDAVTKLCEDFEKVYQKQASFYKNTFEAGTIGETAAKKQKLLRQLAVQNTIEGLTGAGIQTQITDKLADMLTRSVTSGARWTDMVAEMKAYLDPDGDGTGAFAKYAKTYATTAMGQFTGQNNKLMTDALDTEWYMYVGSEIETTREFCQHLTHKRYIHVSEIPTILSGNIDGHQCAMYKKTNLPQGMIEGTTPDNFQVNVGGWNCRHQLLPVSEEAVPADIRAKFEALKQEAIKKKQEEEAKKKAEEEKKQAQEEVFGLLEQFKEYPFAKYANAKKMAENGDIADLELIKSNIQSAQDQIASFTHIPNAMELAKELDLMHLNLLDQFVANVDANLAGMNPTEQIEHLQKQIFAVNPSSKTAKYKDDFLAEKLEVAKKAQLTEAIKADSVETKAYVDTHPKSKKIIDLYNAAMDDLANGDLESANKNLAAANKQIKSNESSKAASAKKAEKVKAEQEAAAAEEQKKVDLLSKFGDLIPDVEKWGTQYDLAAIEAAHTNLGEKIASIKAKYAEGSQQMIKALEKELQYVIDPTYMKPHTLHPTWKIAQAVYAKEIEKAIFAKKSIDVSKNFDAAKALKGKYPEAAKLLDEASKKIKAGDLDAAQGLIDKASAFVPDDSKIVTAAQKKSTKASVFGSSVVDIDFWNAAKKILDKKMIVSTELKPKQKKELLAALESAIQDVNHSKAKEILEKIGYNVDDIYGDFRKAGALWTSKKDSSGYFDRMSGDDYFRPFAEKDWARWSDAEKDVVFLYTDGSSYINEPTYTTYYSKKEGFDGEIRNSWKDINVLTAMIDGSTPFTRDVWLNRGASEGEFSGQYGINLYLYRDNPSALVGKIGTQAAFFSTAHSKSWGFVDHGGKATRSVVYNVYCPRGTKGIYTEPYSAYGKLGGAEVYENGKMVKKRTKGGRSWNGTTNHGCANECEVILQRGSRFRVIKAEYKSGQWFIDMEVIEQPIKHPNQP